VNTVCGQCVEAYYFAHGSAVAKCCDVCLSVCLSVCLFTRISPELHARPLPNFCACCLCPCIRSSSGMLTIGHITHRHEGGDGSAQHGRSEIYNCLVTFRVSRRRRETYCSHARLCVCSLYLRVCPRPHGYTIARTRT